MKELIHSFVDPALYLEIVPRKNLQEEETLLIHHLIDDLYEAGGGERREASGEERDIAQPMIHDVLPGTLHESLVYIIMYIFLWKIYCSQCPLHQALGYPLSSVAPKQSSGWRIALLHSHVQHELTEVVDQYQDSILNRNMN